MKMRNGAGRSLPTYKGYDLADGPGILLQRLLRDQTPVDLTPDFELVQDDDREKADALTVIREGQGAFRVRVLDAYGRRCSVTGERSLPALEAAHIQSYLGPTSNHLQNGLSLRADIHRLFDSGYVTVTPDYRFEVSNRLKDDYKNGHEYYELAGRQLLVIPSRRDARPSKAAREWHANNVYMG